MKKFKDFKEMLLAYIDAEEQEKELTALVKICQDGIDEKLQAIEGSEATVEKMIDGLGETKTVIFSSDSERSLYYDDAPEALRSSYDHFTEYSEKLAKVKSLLTDIRYCIGRTEEGEAVYNTIRLSEIME